MNIEELQAEVLRLREELQTKENLEKQIQEKDERIKSLEEHNQRLFLRATSSHIEEKKEDEEEFKSDILGDYAKLLNDDEIELFKELTEV